jgi:hypothetical protein
MIIRAATCFNMQGDICLSVCIDAGGYVTQYCSPHYQLQGLDDYVRLQWSNCQSLSEPALMPVRQAAVLMKVQ